MGNPKGVSRGSKNTVTIAVLWSLMSFLVLSATAFVNKSGTWQNALGAAGAASLSWIFFYKSFQLCCGALT